MLQATWTAYQLPDAISGAAAVARHGQVLLIGGSNGSRDGIPARSVTRLSPLTGRESALAGLAAPVAGAAAAIVRGNLMVFGGNGGRTGPGVQTVTAGSTATARLTARLPEARSGLTAVTTAGLTYLIGGADGPRRVPTVLRTADGIHFSVVARLPVPVAFTAAVASRGNLWVFGGMTAAGPTNAIQRVDPRSGRAEVVGRLPRPLAAEAALVLGGRIFLAGGLTAPAGGSPAADSPAAGPLRASAAVLGVGPSGTAATLAATLPMPVARAAGAVVRGTGYLVGGTDGSRAVPAVVALRLVPPGKAVPASTASAGGTGVRADSLATKLRPATAGSMAAPGPASAGWIAAMPWLGPATGRGHLAPGSDPAALPAAVLVADHLNNRLVIIDPQGRVRWVFPRPGDLAPRQTFRVPDDAFFSPDGRYIIATQEDDQVISVISVAARKIVYRYGKPGMPGTGPDRADNPDDALLMPSGDIIAADIKNCRVLVVAPPAHRPLRVIGQTTQPCAHDPSRHFGSPNGAFPTSSGGYLVTEINGDWADCVDLNGQVRWSVNPPGVSYPSDTNEVSPGRYLTVDYSNPGQVVEFTRRGRVLWRFGGLDQPSLALPVPNGDVLLNDDFNHRIIVIDPANNRIVWQYGHTGIAGRSPGYLNDPDGLDLVPPDSFLIRHATTMGQP